MKRILLLSLLVSTASFTNGQSGKELLFGSSEFVWCGLDYSNVRCIGAIGFTDPDEIKYKYFNGWNQLMLLEASKYDFKKAYQKSTQITNLSVVERRNDIPDVNEFVIEHDYRFEEGQLKEIISDYNLDNVDSGLGLVYVVESLNKLKAVALIHVVFFDIASKEILWTRRYSTSAAGFGFRNFWAKPIYSTIQTSGQVFTLGQKNYEREQKKKK